MDDGLDVWPGRVDGRMDGEVVSIELQVGGSGVHSLALHVDLQQAGGRHLVEHHAIGRCEEVLVFLADTSLQTDSKIGLTQAFLDHNG